MRLDEYVDDLDRDESVELRRLAEEKSYAITEHIDDARTRLDETLSGDTLVGSTAPSVFVGRSSYPQVSAGVLAPVATRPTRPTTRRPASGTGRGTGSTRCSSGGVAF